MRIIKDPFTGELLLSLDSFESKQVKEKGYVKISTTNNYFGSLRLLYEDLSTILTEELRTIQIKQEKKRHEKLLNKK
jgi:hypothetical protein|tara:strand:- start:280 stop:510 length:231 start_codon:yes stop_codon:yes gene_type:complete